MFFGSRKGQKPADGASHPSGPSGSEAGDRQSPQWRAWRCSAQDVTRASNEWLAGGSRERPELCRRNISALAEEERTAAAIEQTVNVGANDRRPTARITATAHSGASDASDQ